MFDDSAQAGANAPRTTHHAPRTRRARVHSGQRFGSGGVPEVTFYLPIHPLMDDVHMQVSADAKGMC
jgi:hypothetical protein